MEALDSLEQSINLLLARYNQLQQDYLALQKINNEQREEILRSHTELMTLRQDYKHLQEASALLGNQESRTAAKKHLTVLISQVDKALDALKQ